MSADDGFGPPAPDTSAIAFWDPAPDATVGDGSGDGIFRPLFYGEGPLYSANPWDLVILGGEKLPGICSIKCEPQLQIDQQKGPKHDGAILTLHGTLPSPVEISVTIWTAEQWAKFVTLIPLWWRKPLKDASGKKALGGREKKDATLMQAASFIYHPGLTPFGITQVIVKGVSLPEPASAPQSKVVRIKCIEYSPPSKKSAPSKVKKANAAADERVVTDPPSKTSTGPTD